MGVDPNLLSGDAKDMKNTGVYTGENNSDEHRAIKKIKTDSFPCGGNVVGPSINNDASQATPTTDLSGPGDEPGKPEERGQVTGTTASDPVIIESSDEE